MKSAEPRILYGQCWEDADVLLAGLRVRPGDVCLSIGSAGDNSLALLTAAPSRVIVVDANPTQLACLELRVAAYRALEHDELLQLMGSRPSSLRKQLYARCRAALTPATRAFWDRRHHRLFAHGLGGVGRIEGYFRLFRRLVLPLVHSRRTVAELLVPKSRAAREAFFDLRWSTPRLRRLMRGFFSRRVMSWLGREPAFFAHAEGSLYDHVLARMQHALTELEPADNPYLHWILRGRHGDALPLALRAESFERIRANLDRLEWHHGRLEEYAASAVRASVDRFNLSDIFEYLTAERYGALLESLLAVSAPGARLLYWNMMVPRSRPESLAARLTPLDEEAADLHHADRAFFYRRLCLEAVR